MNDKRIKPENLHRTIALRNKKRFFQRYGQIKSMLKDIYKRMIREAVIKEQKKNLESMDLVEEILNLYDGCSFLSDSPRNPNKNTSSKVERNAIMVFENEFAEYISPDDLNLVSFSDEEITKIIDSIKKNIADEYESLIYEAMQIKRMIYRITDISGRQIMIKRYIDGLMYKEIADDIGKSHSYVVKKHDETLNKIDMLWLEDNDD